MESADPRPTRLRPAGATRYENFWKGFRSVTYQQPAQWTATPSFADLRYVAKKGGVSTETRSFRLVRQDGVLKIAESST